MPVLQPDLWSQRGRGPVADRYARWRTAHPELYAEIERRVLARANSGERRIEINDVWASVRHDLKVKLDNSHRSLAARELNRSAPLARPTHRNAQAEGALMARQRSIKPEFFRDRHMAALGSRVALIYQALWLIADDGGVVVAV